MNMAPNPLEFFLLVLLGGGFGSPSVTPTAEDPLAARVAPAECLLYVSWAGSEKPQASSTNHSERLIAEPEVQKFLEVGQSNLLSTMPAGAGAAQVNKLRALVEGKPGAFFVSDVQMRGNDPPDIKAGGILRLDDKLAEMTQMLEQFQQSAPEGSVTEETIGNRKFWKIVPDESGPAIYWGSVGKYLVVGVGEGTVGALLQRARQQPPEWLTSLKQRVHVPRVTSLLYTDLGKMIALGLAESNDPEANQVITALGLDKLTTLVNVSGVDDTGCLSRTVIGVDGQPGGILSLIDSPPLTPADFSGVARDAPVAAALKLDAGRLFDLWINMAKQIDPGSAEQMTMGLQMMQQQLGVNIREDVINSLGDTWRIHTTGGNGLINGWTISIQVRDKARLEAAHAKLLQVGQAALGQAGPGAPSLTSRQVGATTVHMLSLPTPGVPVAPSWCLTEDSLVISLAGTGIDAALSGNAEVPARDGSGSVAEAPALAPYLAAGSKPLAVAYMDTANVARSILPFAQFGLQMVRSQPNMPPMDTANLPSADVVIRHLQPSVAAVKRTGEGVEIVTQQTLPGGNAAGSAPVAVALLLPAVQAAREAARRMSSMNNLKQIALALHNFHDAYRALPAGYSADAAGNPLLSWRVHILPFIEEQALYEEFHLDEPWDSPHNKALIPRMPAVYRSPNSRNEPGKTNYLGIGGADGIFVRPQADSHLGTSFAKVMDGTSNTIMAVEVPDETAVIWTKPADHAPNADAPTQGLTGMRPGGFLASLADGSVQFIAETIDPAVLNAMFSKAGGEPVNR